MGGLRALLFGVEVAEVTEVAEVEDAEGVCCGEGGDGDGGCGEPDNISGDSWLRW